MRKTLMILFALFVIIAPLFGAAPPDRMNFQGVLRGATDAPQNGTFDMVFEFYDAATLGNQILRDSHSAGSAITVTGGLFNVQLGSGVMTDGSGPGVYTSLTNVFRDFSAVFVEVHVASDTLAPRIQVASAGYALNTENADLLDGLDSTAFATASHAHQILTAGTGLGGGTYNGSSPSTFSVAYGAAANTAVQGNQTATITAGSGLTGGVSTDALGDGFSATVNVGPGNGISVAADTVSLGALTSDWIQNGAFDIELKNAGSELKFLESTGGLFFGILDVGDLSANQTYTFSGADGTVWTSGNDGATSTLDADLLDGLSSGSFATSGHVHQNLTAGAGLAGTTYNGGSTSTFDVGAGNGISVAADTISLGPLTADWNQTGAFDITLNNPNSELKILANAGFGAFFGIIDVAPNDADQTYTFSGDSGTIWTSANDGPSSGLNADQFDGLDSTQFLRSDATDSYTSGTLTLNTGTQLDVNGVFRVGTTSGFDDDLIFFDAGGSESFGWHDTNGRFELSDDLFVPLNLGVDGAIQTGVVDVAGSTFNEFRSGANSPQGGEMTGTGDLYVQFDLEVGDDLDISDIGRIVSSSDGLAISIRGQSQTDANLDKRIYLLSTAAGMFFTIDDDNDVATSASGYRWFSNGFADLTMLLTDDTGNLSIDGAFSANGVDLAENYRMGEPLEAGDLDHRSLNN